MQVMCVRACACVRACVTEWAISTVISAVTLWLCYFNTILDVWYTITQGTTLFTNLFASKCTYHLRGQMSEKQNLQHFHGLFNLAMKYTSPNGAKRRWGLLLPPTLHRQPPHHHMNYLTFSRHIRSQSPTIGTCLSICMWRTAGHIENCQRTCHACRTWCILFTVLCGCMDGIFTTLSQFCWTCFFYELRLFHLQLEDCERYALWQWWTGRGSPDRWPVYPTSIILLFDIHYPLANLDHTQESIQYDCALARIGLLSWS